jgi:hypothetical protein
MTDMGNGIYSVQLAIPSGSFLFYRFINGNSLNETESVPFTCGVLNNGGYYERVTQLDTTTTVLPLVCFNECADCGNEITDLHASPISLYPNPTSNQCNILSDEMIERIQVYDATGRLMLNEQALWLNSYSLNTSIWENGTYWLVVNGQHPLAIIKTE